MSKKYHKIPAEIKADIPPRKGRRSLGIASG
jgi:hypothetical protein